MIIYDTKSVPPSFLFPSFIYFPFLPSTLFFLPFLFPSFFHSFFAYLSSPFLSLLLIFLSIVATMIFPEKMKIYSSSFSSMHFIFNPTKRMSNTLVFNVLKFHSSHPSSACAQAAIFLCPSPLYPSNESLVSRLRSS